MVKNRLKCLYYQASFDRVIILLASVSLVVALVLAQVKRVSIGIFIISLVVVLFIRLAIYLLDIRPKRNPDCLRRPEAMKLMTKLANEMNVRLHPTKSLEIIPELRNASCKPWPFISGWKVHSRGRVRIGCTILCGLDNVALEGVIAHELAHLKKRHFLRFLAFLLPFLLVFFAVLVYLDVSKSTTAFLLTLLTVAIGFLVYSLVSWRQEYEADAVAAKDVGPNDMAHALEQAARLIDRPRDTLSHPSFKKRISRLLLDEKSNS
jgi:Zn-dependent protease with chaperone function